VPALSDQIADGPMVLSALKIIETEFGKLAAS
jgi:hypothetical protein